ncbi:MAG: DNA primase [Candidatus Omnitrophota bacterium]|jgi:DNA primase
MAGHIPEIILDSILSRIDIVELIGSSITLKRAGRNFKGICPFHHEKTPSFVVSADKQIYHCFGCGAGGNAFNFLVQYERLEFLEAVEVLAKKAGVVLPEKQKQNPLHASLNAQLYKVNALALAFYEKNLETASGKKAKEYLLKRGITPDALKVCKVGVALDAWDALLTHLRSHDMSLSLMEKAGLILPRQTGSGYYDRFRNRIIVPIFDIKENVIAFGARLLPETESKLKEEQSPKYVNSPETPVYVKGRNLYGLHLSREAIRKQDCAVVVEGYLDFMMPYQQGVQNVVASLGTALTDDQIRLIKRYTRNVVMVYDGDLAGQMATLRSLDLLIEEDMQVKVVSLPEGYDPDSFVRKFGALEFQAKITDAENVFDYKMRMLKSRYPRSEVESKVMISAEMLSTIQRCKNEIVRSEYIKKLSQELDVLEESLLLELKKLKEERPASGEQAVITHPKKLQPLPPTERLLIQLLLEETTLIERVRDSLELEDFQNENAAKMMGLLFSLSLDGKVIEPKSLMNRFPDEEISQLVCESSCMPEVFQQDKEKIVNDCIQRLKMKRTSLHRHRLQKEIKTAQTSGNDAQIQKLMREFQHLIQKR